MLGRTILKHSLSIIEDEDKLETEFYTSILDRMIIRDNAYIQEYTVKFSEYFYKIPANFQEKYLQTYFNKIPSPINESLILNYTKHLTELQAKSSEIFDDLSHRIAYVHIVLRQYCDNSRIQAQFDFSNKQSPKSMKSACKKLTKTFILPPPRSKRGGLV